MRTKSKYREIKSQSGELSAVEKEMPPVEATITPPPEAPVVAAVEPPEPKPEVPEPQDEASLALRKQIDAIRRSEELSRQQAAQMMAAQVPVTREQKIEFWRSQGLSDEEAKFLQANPDMIDHSAITNHAAAEALQAGHERDSEPYFAAVKEGFTRHMEALKAQAQSQAAKSIAPAPAFFQPPPPKAPRSPPSIVSAPVSREVPSIAQKLKLPTFAPGQRLAWPPPQPPMAAVYAMSMVPQHDPRYTADWAAAQKDDNVRRAATEARWAGEEAARQAESRRIYEASLRR